jgi:hypothetical protein
MEGDPFNFRTVAVPAVGADAIPTGDYAVLLIGPGIATVPVGRLADRRRARALRSSG